MWRAKLRDGSTLLNACFHRNLWAHTLKHGIQNLAHAGLQSGVTDTVERRKVSVSKRAVLLVRLRDKHSIVCARTLLFDQVAGVTHK